MLMLLERGERGDPGGGDEETWRVERRNANGGFSFSRRAGLQRAQRDPRGDLRELWETSALLFRDEELLADKEGGLDKGDGGGGGPGEGGRTEEDDGPLHGEGSEEVLHLEEVRDGYVDGEDATALALGITDDVIPYEERVLEGELTEHETETPPECILHGHDITTFQGSGKVGCGGKKEEKRKKEKEKKEKEDIDQGEGKTTNESCSNKRFTHLMSASNKDTIASEWRCMGDEWMSGYEKERQRVSI